MERGSGGGVFVQVARKLPARRFQSVRNSSTRNFVIAQHVFAVGRCTRLACSSDECQISHLRRFLLAQKLPAGTPGSSSLQENKDFSASATSASVSKQRVRYRTR